MDKIKKETQYVNLDRPVFTVAVICCLIFFVPLIIFQKNAQPVVQEVMDIVSNSFDWFFEGTCFSGSVQNIV